MTPTFEVKKEMGKHIPLRIPAVSEEYGPVKYVFFFFFISIKKPIEFVWVSKSLIMLSE